ncbi:MAG: membrane protein [Phycisphaerae bacterium]
MLDAVSRILFTVSSGVLVPVILGLLGLTAWTLLMMGGFVGELVTRRAARRALAPALSGLLEGDPRVAVLHLTALAGSVPATGFVPRYLRTCWGRGLEAARANKLIDDMEIEMARIVGRASAVARVGPMLGLAGTLIPLGPGLVSLAGGDVAGLAGQLVIAFSTTVVGLLIGMAAFACAQVRRGWYARDLSDILFLEETRTQRPRPEP